MHVHTIVITYRGNQTLVFWVGPTLILTEKADFQSKWKGEAVKKSIDCWRSLKLLAFFTEVSSLNGLECHRCLRRILFSYEMLAFQFYFIKNFWNHDPWRFVKFIKRGQWANTSRIYNFLFDGIEDVNVLRLFHPDFKEF